MLMKITLRSPEGVLEWERYYDVRYRLLRKPWGAPRGEERMPEDAVAKHLALFLGDKLIGVGMVHKDDSGNARIRLIAIDAPWQRKGFGAKLMAGLENIARKDGYKKAVLWGDENAVAFYEKLGYKNKGKGPIIFGKLQQYNMEKDL